MPETAAVAYVIPKLFDLHCLLFGAAEPAHLASRCLDCQSCYRPCHSLFPAELLGDVVVPLLFERPVPNAVTGSLATSRHRYGISRRSSPLAKQLAQAELIPEVA